MAENKMSFEDSMNRLSEIVAKLEAGKEPLEESIKLFEEGTALAGRCYEALRQAETKIEELAPEEDAV